MNGSKFSAEGVSRCLALIDEIRDWRALLLT